MTHERLAPEYKHEEGMHERKVEHLHGATTMPVGSTMTTTTYTGTAPLGTNIVGERPLGTHLGTTHQTYVGTEHNPEVEEKEHKSVGEKIKGAFSHLKHKITGEKETEERLEEHPVQPG